MTGRMTRAQAKEIQRHLLAASRALERAGAVIADLGEPDRRALTGRLADVSSQLYFDLLEYINEEHPELTVWLEAVPTAHVLSWDEVVLPPAVAEPELDELIFSLLKPDWRKTAMILAMASPRCEELALSLKIVAARIRALAEAGRIDHQGDLRRWRASEVRLMPGKG
ncbi:hypothetical protein SSBR45G_19270 [Bradyrhizobium sp. SSBR45G]|uniref:DUF3658 domain-containing protein n=1 Tax=unclassified Bradyrhizobium TaxID=2631580 RepID=UPI0023429F1F|nr:MULTISPECIES: DUF3658 domain-containing protein [unclassified Bradyrhizobium]GLH77019.1 hypothetical protein SSBR45G_19270 [Bradyrhizobium sp. SSBR45G]GLH83777.1 hypothetical protein SSBR45R_12370 [Bradyrhizobium sp. SSBR45R]